MLWAWTGNVSSGSQAQRFFLLGIELNEKPSYSSVRNMWLVMYLVQKPPGGLQGSSEGP